MMHGHLNVKLLPLLYRTTRTTYFSDFGLRNLQNIIPVMFSFSLFVPSLDVAISKEVFYKINKNI